MANAPPPLVCRSHFAKNICSRSFCGVLRLFPGVLLLSGGSLKLVQYLSGDGSIGMEIPTRIVPFVAIVELVVAVHLIFGLLRYRWALWIALSMYCIFAGVNAFHVWSGSAACSCFAVFQVPSSLTLCLDVIAIAILLVALSGAELGRHRPNKICRLGVVSLLLVATTFLTIWTISASGYAPWWRAWLSRESIIISTDPRLVEAQCSEFATANVMVENKGAQPITLFGTEGNCGIHFDASFPVTIAPRSSVSLKANMIARDLPQRYLLKSNLITDVAGGSAVTVILPLVVSAKRTPFSTGGVE